MSMTPVMMSDPRVREFCEYVFDLAATYLDTTPMSRVRLALGDRSVTVHTPDVTPHAGIDPREAFRAPDDERLTADFDVVVIDARGPGQLLAGRWPSEWHAPLGVISPRRTDPYRVAIDRHTQSISIFDTARSRGVVWMRDYRDMPYWAAATPWRLMLSWCADTFDGEFVHAAALARDGRAVLLVGPSGTGKSTLAFQAAESGWDLVGDDFVLVHSNRVYPVYTRGKLHDQSIPVLSRTWQILNAASPDQKRIIDIDVEVRRIPRHGTRIGGVIAPMRGDGAQIIAEHRGKVFLRCAPYSLAGLLGGTERSLLRIRWMLTDVPCYVQAVSRCREDDLACLHQAWQNADAA